MADVFVGYAKEDHNFVSSLVQALESVGLSVWWDSNLHAGEEYAPAIEGVLDCAGAAIVVWSKSSVASEFVANEASIALEREILVTVRIDDCKLPIQFRGRHTILLKRSNLRSSDPVFQNLLLSIFSATRGVRLPAPSRRSPRTHLLTRALVVVALPVAAWFALKELLPPRETLSFSERSPTSWQPSEVSACLAQLVQSGEKPTFKVKYGSSKPLGCEIRATVSGGGWTKSYPVRNSGQELALPDLVLSGSEALTLSIGSQTMELARYTNKDNIRGCPITHSTEMKSLVYGARVVVEANFDAAQ